jgi:Cof subfamily protein (haloacid dehalogenase superfamily)
LTTKGLHHIAGSKESDKGRCEMKKLVIFDIDGTLVSYKNETHIPVQTIQAIQKLKEKGNLIAVATARSYLFTVKILEELSIDYAVLHNGAEIVINNRSVYEKKIGKRNSINICRELIKTSLCVLAFNENHIYVHNLSGESKRYIESEIGKTNIIKPLQDSKDSLFSISVYGKSNEFSNFANKIIPIDFSEREHQIIAANISKGKAIKHLAKLLKMMPKDIVAVGDGINDIEMLRVAKIGIAVGSASSELKSVADMVTDDIDDGGILNCFKLLGYI